MGLWTIVWVAFSSEHRREGCVVQKEQGKKVETEQQIQSGGFKFCFCMPYLFLTGSRTDPLMKPPGNTSRNATLEYLQLTCASETAG